MQGSFHRFRVSRSVIQATDDQALPPTSSTPSTSSPTKSKGQTCASSHRATPPTAAACQRCRRLKKKCSKTRPECTLCIAAGLLCSFTESSNLSAIPTPNTQQLQARIAWLSRFVNGALPSDAPSIEWLETGTDISLGLSQTVNYSRAPESDSTYDRAMDRLSNMGSAKEPASATSVAGGYSEPGNTLALMSEQAASVASSHDSAVGHALTTMDASGPPIHHSPGRLIQRLPEEAVGRQFIGAYFRDVHRVYPFLNRQQVLNDVEAMGDMINEGIEKIPTKLYMIMAVGCTTLRRVGQVSDETLAKFKISYDAILVDCLAKNDVESVETLLLLGLQSLFDPTGISPWHITGILARQVVFLRLSRKAAPSQGLSLLEVEMRHRLFWSIYTLDRLVAVTMGVAPSVVDANMSVPLPSVTFEEYATAERGYYTLTLQVNRHIISLRQLEGKILQEIHLSNHYKTSSLTQADRWAIVQDLRSQIENWYTQGCLLTPLDGERDNIPFHNTIPWLNIRYQNLLFLLYLPSHFNSPMSDEHVIELHRCTQKNIQLTAVLFNQRHLPLNWVTLCRFVSICSVLLYCFLKSARGLSLPRAIDEVTICAEILEAFDSGWHFAKRGAHIFRLLAAHANLDRPHPASNLASLYAVSLEVVDLVRDVLGDGSIYARSNEASAELVREYSESQSLDPFRSELQLDNSLMEERPWPGSGPLSMEFMS